MSGSTIFYDNMGIKAGWVNVYRHHNVTCGVSYGEVRGTQELARLLQAEKPIYRLRVRPWIMHGGGQCPVKPETMLRIRLRSGQRTHDAYRANSFFWGACGDATIVAYQIMDEKAGA